MVSKIQFMMMTVMTTLNWFPLSTILDLIRIVGAEKESGMKEMLNIMGVSLRMQWAAWWARAVVVLFPVALFVSATMALLFDYISFGVLFALMLCYFAAFTSSAFFITCWWVCGRCLAGGDWLGVIFG